MEKLYIGLGSNLGDRQALLLEAVKHIDDRVGRVSALSSFYETEAWGFVSDNRFLNAALCAETELDVLSALDITQAIEREMGRVSKSAGGVYSDRPIDIDLLLYGSMTVNVPRLTLPHPLMHRRLFVLQPLTEIAPQLLHPVLRKTMSELLAELGGSAHTSL